MIKVEKERDRVFITITSQLDREDVYDLVSDLNKWLDDTVELPTFKGLSEDKVKEAFNGPSRVDRVNSAPSSLEFHNEAHKEAYEQAQSKLKLEKDMKRYFVDVFDSEYIEKMAKVYELDALNREIQITQKKLKQLK
jgi:hypothetical protein